MENYYVERDYIMALKDKVHDISSLPCFIWISYQKSLSNESKAKLDLLKAFGFRICNYQNMQGDLSINEWDIIIVQVSVPHRSNRIGILAIRFGLNSTRFERF